MKYLQTIINHPDNTLFVLILSLSFLISFTIPTYNVPLYIFFLYMWNHHKKQQIDIFLLIFVSLLFDIMLVIYHTKSYEIRFALKKYPLDSWSQKLSYFNAI